jgi:hypothetical protein
MYFQARIRIRNEVSTEILKGRSFQLWRARYVFAVSLLFVAEYMQVPIKVSFREFPMENPRLLRKETATGPRRCFISFSCKYRMQLIKHSEIK